METFLGFFLLLIQLAPSLSYLTSICFNSRVKVLGSWGWVLTVQCMSRVLYFFCYRRVDVVSHVVVLFYLFRVSAILILNIWKDSNDLSYLFGVGY